jgi:hypothetical protein
MGGRFALANTQFRRPGGTHQAADQPEPDSARARSNSTTARASIDSPCPTGPERSAVLAFTLTAPAPMPRHSAMRAAHGRGCAAPAWAPARSRCCPRCRSRSLLGRTGAHGLGQQHDRIGALESARRCRGNGVPMSPSPAAPSKASVMACSSTSASEWPSRPWVCGMVTPPDDQRPPGHQGVHVPALTDAKGGVRGRLMGFAGCRLSGWLRPAPRSLRGR